MKTRMLTVLIIAIFIIPLVSDTGNHLPYENKSKSMVESPIQQSISSSDPGVTSEPRVYSIIELPDAEITSSAWEWSFLLNESGLVTNVFTVNEILSNSALLDNSEVILLDSSLGSYNSTVVSDSLLDILIFRDAPLFLLGQAAWLLYRLRGSSPPSSTALSTSILLSTTDYEGAVFLDYPYSLVIGSELTTENMDIPIDTIQTEHSRIVNLLDRENAGQLSPLRYDSWPLDAFLFAPSIPNLLTNTGKKLLVNVLAYSSALSESSTTRVLQEHQVTESSPFLGGFEYYHEQKIASTYHAVKAIKNLNNNSAWESWVLNSNSSILDLLNRLYVQDNSEAGFLSSQSSSSYTVKNTAQGLWLVSVLGLTDFFNVSALSEYIANHQEVEGGFENDIIVTSVVLSSLSESGELSKISIIDAEYWMRSCVIDGSKTTNSKLWGGIGRNPTDLNPSTQYAYAYLTGLQALGESHDDPLKLAEWITKKVGNADGSYNNTIDSVAEIIIGTACALSSLNIMGTLNAENRTNGFNWIVTNQLESGGFGIRDADSDIVAKIEESYLVSACLNLIGERDSSTSEKLLNFVKMCKSETGFEEMQRLPSLMWSSWLSSIARYTHGWNHLNQELFDSYLSIFSSWSIYPFWNNLSILLANEYSFNQYRTKSVWSQYFGVTAATSLGLELSSDIIDTTEAYLIIQQDSSGHYRNSMSLDTPSIQFSVAAIETLYLMGSIDSIQYRSELETKILEEYSSGSWNIESWTLRPFEGNQPVIDWLSTRAALRLDIVTSTMASEIASVIEARVQYEDLWALSCDVATLALLNSSGFTIDLDSVNSSRILEELDTSLIIEGWFNNTQEWQPVYTASVLEMISILGLRLQISDIQGTTVSASCSPNYHLGDSIELSVSISGGHMTHTLVVYAFNTATLFDNVLYTDSVHIQVPESADALGAASIYIMIFDWNTSRSFDICNIGIYGILSGNLSVHTPEILPGQVLNSTIEFALDNGEDIGICNITAGLENSTHYFEWSYIGSSPFDIQLPTTDLSPDEYNLSIVITHDYCDPLTQHEIVYIHSPIPTYIQSSGNQNGSVGLELSIDCSLHFVSNDSMISDQTILLTIYNAESQVVYSDYLISDSTSSAFDWIPEQKGNYTYNLEFAQNNSYVSSKTSGNIKVFEHSELEWFSNNSAIQYEPISLTGRLTNSSGYPIVSVDVSVIVTDPSSVVVIDSVYTTNSTGFFVFPLTLSENGYYEIKLEYLGSIYVVGDQLETTLLSWTTTNVTISGLPTDGIVDHQYTIISRLVDSANNPLIGIQITLKITYLPSSVVYNTVFVTNGTGHIDMDWSGSIAGSYKIEALFLGSNSLVESNSSSQIDLRLGLQIIIITDSSYDVNKTGTITIEVIDQNGDAVSDLITQIDITDIFGELVYTTIGTVESGYLHLDWSPTIRGHLNICSTVNRQFWYDAATEWNEIQVYDTPNISTFVVSQLIAPSSFDTLVSIKDTDSNAIQNVVCDIVVRMNDDVILTGSYTTNSLGNISLNFEVVCPGILSISISFESQAWLRNTSSETLYDISGSSSLTLTTPGQPINQGTTVIIVATLLDWNNQPISGVTIQIQIKWANGSLIQSTNKTSSIAGKVSVSFTFTAVGDYTITASFLGDSDNAASQSSSPQRVYVTPNVQLEVGQTCILGDSISIGIGITNTYSGFIQGRTLLLQLIQDSIVIHEEQVESGNDLQYLTWNPIKRGIVSISLYHAGDLYYYSNNTEDTLTVFEQITSDFTTSESSIELYENVTFTYAINDASNKTGIMIEFQVLGIDLVPIWTSQQSTNSSGISLLHYTCDDSHGILTVRAFPIDNQYLVGGEKQKQLTILTDCIVNLGFSPSPASLDKSINISVLVLDEFSLPLSSISVTIALDDPRGNPVKLGSWSNTITVQTDNMGYARVSITLQLSGLYTISADSPGTVSVHGFSESELHAIFCPTELTLEVNQTDIRVGDGVKILASLRDYFEVGMASQNIVFFLDGPGSTSIGPTTLVTNSSGYAIWDVTIDIEGLWTLTVSFEGIGVYLESDCSYQIDVDYPTSLIVDYETGQNPIAGVKPLSVSVLLVDGDDAPLEGFTIKYSIYHEIFGLVDSGSVIQFGQIAIELNISFSVMGEHTIIFDFDGTTHYHPSSSALMSWVLGTTAINITLPTNIERSQKTNATITLSDESNYLLTPHPSFVELELENGHGFIDLGDRLLWFDSQLVVNVSTLPVGTYSLHIWTENTELRIGTELHYLFNVTSTTKLEIIDNSLTFIINEAQSVTFILLDSLESEIPEKDVRISLFDPNGREIFGSPLTTYSLISIPSGGYELTWTPSLTGNYSLVINFEGDTYLDSAVLEMDILVRVRTTLTLEVSDEVDFGNPITLSVNIVGGLSRMKNTSIIVSLYYLDEFLSDYSLTTSSNGIASSEIQVPLAGDYIVVANYVGTNYYAPSSANSSFRVLPRMTVSVTDSSGLHVGVNCSVIFEIHVIGVSLNWSGVSNIIVISPTTSIIYNYTITIGAFDVFQLSFVPDNTGVYLLTFRISPVPLFENLTQNLQMNAIEPPIYLTLDMGTVPVIGGLGIIGVLVAVFLSRFGKISGKLPTEWAVDKKS
ncbi:MAG: hypothetical protein BAJATHORv1_40158 [Candidatus Thorarchaeota archaeon]|nr:MAG: hypothetical protein BAJATHORv1_40158 [Candidatus Thorarchaeota archaeon]